MSLHWNEWSFVSISACGIMLSFFHSFEHVKNGKMAQKNVFSYQIYLKHKKTGISKLKFLFLHLALLLFSPKG